MFKMFNLRMCEFKMSNLKILNRKKSGLEEYLLNMRESEEYIR